MRVLLWAGRGMSAHDRVGRAVALSEALAARGVASRMALPAEDAALGWLEAAGVRNPVLLPERDPDLPHVLAAAAGAAAVVVDVDRPLSRTEMRALAGGRPVVVIEGSGTGAADADVCVALGADPRAGRCLGGPAWVPLRRAVRLARELRTQPRPMPLVVVHVNAANAEADVARMLAGVAAARAAGAPLAGRLVADPRMPAWSRLGALARRLDLPPPLPALPDVSIATFAEAEVALVTGGMAVWEAVACGAATVVVGDAPGAAGLAAAGAVVSLGAAVDEDRVAAAVTTLVTSAAARATLAGAAAAVVDGHGADRLADRLISLLAPPRTVDVRERHAG